MQNANTGEKKVTSTKVFEKSKKPILHGYFVLKIGFTLQTTLRQPFKKTSPARDLMRSLLIYFS